MDIPGRMTCANMVIEMGAKAGIVPPDEKTWEYLCGRTEVTPFSLASDEDAKFFEKRDYDVSKINPKIAVPHNVDNVVDVTEVAGKPVDQVFIGSCTNGRYEDFAEAAVVLGDNVFSEDVRVIMVPASKANYMKVLKA